MPTYILPGEPTGKISTEFQGAYFSPAPTGSPSKHAILLLTDASGLALKNPMIIADELAKRLERDVWVPDYFKGRPLFPVDAIVQPDRHDAKLTIIEWLRFIISFVVALVSNLPNIVRNRPSVVDKRIEYFIAILKEKRQYETIGAVGYGFGGAICIRFAATNLLERVVVAHPARFTLKQLKAIKIPTSWIWAPEDFFFPESRRQQVSDVLFKREGKENTVKHGLVGHYGAKHGFALRPTPNCKTQYDVALNQIEAWFTPPDKATLRDGSEIHFWLRRKR
ncbi:hypothetical protein D9613_012101 [Agrocybe pediades]|uniref:Dienelactone hydrolase domain-containing protein n=1 Tax=Agrocybe pediades TaxID=84607 RepID=A0A8H4R268_9AGAR|nr:hypothetical protein D9613_012101 [Agrocybe pediades]